LPTEDPDDPELIVYEHMVVHRANPDIVGGANSSGSNGLAKIFSSSSTV